MLAPIAAAAQNDSALQLEHQKFTIIGTGLKNQQQVGTGLSSSLNIDQFLNLERIMRQEDSFSVFPDENDWNESTRLVADYYFGFGAFVPMIGISMGYLQDENKNSQLVAGPEIGAKYFMNQQTFLYGLLGYQFPFEKTDEPYDDNGQLVYGVGLGITFSY